MQANFLTNLKNILNLEESKNYSEAIFEIDKYTNIFPENKYLLESLRLRINNKLQDQLNEMKIFKEKDLLENPLAYLILNEDLYSLLNKNDNLETIQEKLRKHYEEYGKNESWRPLNLNTKLVKSYKEASEKEYDDLKKLFYDLAKKEFKDFCKSNRFININNSGDLHVSIIIILHNKDALTYKCLNSLSEISDTNIELIIIDNNSTDRTDLLLSKLKGNIKIIKNKTNLHFVKSVNQALEFASKEFVALVNNDTILDPFIFSNAYKTLSSLSYDPIIGGMVMHLDGRIQDAGSIVFKDGSCLGLGRRAVPNCSLYNFKRTVDYISGCFLFCKKNIFETLNGFDTRFAPAYFEETDFCFRFSANNGKIIYQPECKLWHYEYGSDSSTNNKQKLMRTNQKKFFDIHSQVIKNKLSRNYFNESNINYLMYGHIEDGNKILIIDDKFPSQYIGAGFSRAADIFNILLKETVFISYYITNYNDNDQIDNTNFFNVEVIKESLNNSQDLHHFLLNRQDFYSKIIISRSHNHSAFLKAVNKLPDPCKQNILNKSIIDIESIFCIRQGLHEYLKTNKVLPNENSLIPNLDKKLDEELNGFSEFSEFYTVSKVEKDLLINSGKLKSNSKIFLVPHVMRPQNIDNSYNEFLKRNEIGFLGSFSDLDSPNIDSIKWLNKELIYEINKILKPNKQITVVGNSTIECKKIINEVELSHKNFKYLGKIEDLSEFFSKLKVFIVPTRIGAGISHKLHLAASYGIPIVSTDIIANQMSLESGEDIFTANTSKEFATKIGLIFNNYEIWKKLSNSSINITIRDCNLENWERTILNSIS